MDETCIRFHQTPAGGLLVEPAAKPQVARVGRTQILHSEGGGICCHMRPARHADGETVARGDVRRGEVDETDARDMYRDTRLQSQARPPKACKGVPRSSRASFSVQHPACELPKAKSQNYLDETPKMDPEARNPMSPANPGISVVLILAPMKTGNAGQRPKMSILGPRRHPSRGV